MRTICIVPFAEAHVKAIAEIEQVCFPDPWTEQGLREELDNGCARFLTAVDQDGTIAGYIGCHTVLDEGYIANVAVSPAYRRQGIGRRLVQTLLEQSQDLSFVTLEVRVSNEPAIALYQGCGFQPVGIRKKFYSHPTEDALLMTVTLETNR
ncbi:MAG: ribosomal protein S18-alanine N-acetyltransferase [Clostridia bacterium]|nr:ribosomal protein S18-alanine N-acetyltransferase [Clostridia bacterium]